MQEIRDRALPEKNHEIFWSQVWRVFFSGSIWSNPPQRWPRIHWGHVKWLRDRFLTLLKSIKACWVRHDQRNVFKYAGDIMAWLCLAGGITKSLKIKCCIAVLMLSGCFSTLPGLLQSSLEMIQDNQDSFCGCFFSRAPRWVQKWIL